MSNEYRTILVTGAAGEIGQGLVEHLVTQCSRLKQSERPLSSPKTRVILLDRNGPDRTAQGHGTVPAAEGNSFQADSNLLWVKCDITDRAGLEVLFGRFDIDAVFHLAAILSSGGEREPMLAHKVNVEGSLYLLELARQQSARRVQGGGARTKFIFPSSIAVYGMPSLEAKRSAGAVAEPEFLSPITMYGINKLYVEHLGRYYSKHYGALVRNLRASALSSLSPIDGELLDFRAVRFPGLLSAHSVPTGGTSDYGPEILHAAAQKKRYQCFVTPDTTLPFMAMPDAVQCLLSLLEAPAEKMVQRIYNVTSFTIRAEEILERAKQAFGEVHVDFVVDEARQRIVNSWPTDMDDSAARKEWGWTPALSIDRTFSEYLIPGIRQRYEGSGLSNLCASSPLSCAL